MLSDVRLDDAGQLEIAAILTLKFFEIEDEKNNLMFLNDVGRNYSSGNYTNNATDEHAHLSNFPRNPTDKLAYQKMIVKFLTVMKLIDVSDRNLNILIRPRDLRKIFVSNFLRFALACLKNIYNILFSKPL
jgi:hypothetical protein